MTMDELLRGKILLSIKKILIERSVYKFYWPRENC